MSKEEDNDITITNWNEFESTIIAQNILSMAENQNIEQLLATIIEDNRRRDAEAIQRDQLTQALIRRLEIGERTANEINQRSSNNPVDGNTQSTFQIVPHLNRSIEDFHGDKDATTAREWIRNLDSMQRLHRWPEGFVLESARIHSRGGAYQWLQPRLEELDTWEKFRDAFNKTFVGKEDQTTKWQRMVKRTQRRGGPTNLYYHEQVKMCKDLRLTNAEIKKQVLVELWAREPSTSLATKEYNDLDDLLHDIQNVEKMNSRRNDTIRSARNVEANKTKGPGSNLKTEPAQVTKDTTEEKPKQEKRAQVKNEQGEPKCYNCQEYGHLARDCTKERRELRCRTCNGVGHTQKHCTRSTNVVNTISGVRANSVQKFLKPVEINGKTLTAFVDMGSSECTIKTSVAIENQYQINSGKMELRGWGTPPQVNISPGWISANMILDEVEAECVRVRLVPDEAQTFEVIIGRTFTELPHVGYCKQGEKLNFYECKTDNPHEKIRVHEENDNIIRISEDVTLPAGTVNLITVETNIQEQEMLMCNAVGEDKSIRQGELFEYGVMHVVTGDEELRKETVHAPITKADVNVGSEQSDETILELISILNEYRDCIATNLSELGCTDKIEMDIVEVPGSKPFQTKPYRASQKERQQIQKIVGEWKEAGIVTETKSPYASPVLLVTKKTGEARLVVDFRRLNAQTSRVNVPLTIFDDDVEVLAGTKIYIVLDLANGYLQVKLTEQAREKTAFITPDETGEFTRMIFGLTNAPYVFVQLMRTVLGSLLQKRLILFYLDDILIPGVDYQDALRRLKLVLDALREANLTIKLSKCEFLKSKVTYLGYEVTEKGILPGERKVRAIEDYPPPTDVHAVRRFIGLASFCRRFVTGFAIRAAPLTQLFKKEQPFKWEEAQEKAFQDIKEAISQRPVLAIYDPKKETELHTDASALGLAAMLFQRGEDGHLHLVYAISRRTSPPEKVYHSSKLELLAVMWAITRLRMYLIDIIFKVVTDCQSLVYLNAQRTVNPQIARWANSLSEYQFEIIHRPGERMQHVDALSRAPTEDAPEESNEYEGVFTIVSPEDEITMFQSQDVELRKKIEILKKPVSERQGFEKSEIKDYELHDGILYKKINEQLKYIVPKAMRKGLVIRCHDMMGHFGIDRTCARILEYYYFPKMKEYVRQHIKACIHCLFSKTMTGKPPGELHPIPPGKKPFSIVHMDHVGPFVTSSRGNKHVLVIIDNLTKLVRLEAVKSTDTAAVIKRMENFILDFGAPERIVTDRGRGFTSEKFEKFCQKHGIKHSLTSPRHAQANGQVERVNRTLIPIIQANLTEETAGRDWDKNMKQIAWYLNTSINKATGRTAFEMLYGYNPRSGEGLIRKLTVDEEESRYQEPEKLREKTRQKIESEQQKYKTRYDKRHRTGVEYQIGDIVSMKTAPQQTGEPTKLQYKYRGPLVINKVLPSDTYGVTDLRQTERGRRYASTAHVSQLKLWRANDPELDEDKEVETEPETENNAAEIDYGETTMSGTRRILMDNQTQDMERNDGDKCENMNEGNETKEPKRGNRQRQVPRKLKDYELS